MINKELFNIGKRYNLKTERGRRWAIDAVLRGYFENESTVEADAGLYFPDEEAENDEV